MTHKCLGVVLELCTETHGLAEHPSSAHAAALAGSRLRRLQIYWHSGAPGRDLLHPPALGGAPGRGLRRHAAATSRPCLVRRQSGCTVQVGCTAALCQQTARASTPRHLLGAAPVAEEVEQRPAGVRKARAMACTRDATAPSSGSRLRAPAKAALADVAPHQCHMGGDANSWFANSFSQPHETHTSMNSSALLRKGASPKAAVWQVYGVPRGGVHVPPG